MLDNAKQISVALAVNGQRHAIVIKSNDETKVSRVVRYDLHDANNLGHHALAQLVGNATLYMIRGSHPEVFAHYPMLTPPNLSSLDRLRDVVFDLFERSRTERTSAYVSAIDAIFARHAVELAQTDLPEQWPTFRASFMRYD